MSLELIKKYQEQVELGYVRQVTNGDLILFNYTDKCTYDRAWNEYTRNARGIIFNSTTGELIAKPFAKFFNLGEMPETTMSALPVEPYGVYEKLDGSLGIVYHHGGKWNVATRGAFCSEQAVKAEEILQKYETDTLSKQYTYLVEIIYPGNKIVVNYGQEESLVLLAIMHGENELDFQDVTTAASYAEMPVTKRYDYTIEEMIELQKTMPKDQEGFVVRFANGLRVKIKGHEYLKIHKMISNMSPLSFWESMTDGVVNREYLAQLPEEFKQDFEPMVEHLELQYNEVLYAIKADIQKLPVKDVSSKENLKTIGIFTQNANSGLSHPGAIFPYLLNKPGALDKYVMKTIRPTGNILI